MFFVSYYYEDQNGNSSFDSCSVQNPINSQDMLNATTDWIRGSLQKRGISPTKVVILNWIKY